MRPDAVSLDPGGRLTATVAARTFRRDHWSVQIELDGTEPAGAGAAGAGPRLEALVRGADPPAPGERVRLDIDPDGVVPVAP